MSKAISVSGLTKQYPRIRAVDGVSFSVDEGEIFGFLGPNGAGKTTTIRILLTLVKPTSGTIRLFDIDQVAHPQQARQVTGYVPQDVSVDGELTGYENLLMYARLFGIPRKEREARIREVLQYLELTDRAKDMVSTYSGGMMRRLEIAQALVNRPRLLFLDEPSIGLDPSAQRTIWDLILRLRDEFQATIFLTTHDMNEADTLCDRVGIMDRGKLVVLDTPAALKSTVGGDLITIASRTPGAADKLKNLGYAVIAGATPDQFDLVVTNGESFIPQFLAALHEAGIAVDTISLKKPSLGDVFLKYTGARIEEGQTWLAARRSRRNFQRLTR